MSEKLKGLIQQAKDLFEGGTDKHGPAYGAKVDKWMKDADAALGPQKQKRVQCPTCNGGGEQEVTSTDFVTKKVLSRSTIKCVVCKGKGLVASSIAQGVLNELGKDKKFMMRLCSVGNPDFGQYAPVSNPKTVFGDTLKEMRKHCEEYQKEWDLGGGNWTHPVVYDVTGPKKKVVGNFSYNGRFWKGKWDSKNWEKQQEIKI